MAKIPMGNFGQSMPNVERVQLPQNQSGQIIGAALQNVSQVAGTIATKQEDERKKQDNLSALTTVSQFSLDAESMAADYRQKIASNQMSDTDADLEFSKEYAIKMGDVVSQLPKSVSQDYQGKLTQYGTSQIGTFYQTGRNVASDLAKTNLKLTLDNAAKMGDQVAALPIIENAFSAADGFISPSEKLEYKVNYNQQQQSNSIGYRLASASTEQEYQGIYDDMRDENKYSNIPGTLRNSMMQSAQSGVSRIQKQEQQAQNKRESVATQLVNSLQSNVLSGGKIDLDYITNMETATQGTAAYKDFQFWSANYNGIQKFMNLNTNDQKLKLDKLEREFKNSPSDNASDRKKLLDTYRHVYSEKVSDAKSDNVAAAGNLGIEVKAFTGQQLISDPSGAMSTIVNNMLALNEAKKKEPNISLDPIPNLNKGDIQSSFEKASAKQKLDVLASVMKGAQRGGLPLSAVKGIITTIGGGDGMYNIAATAVANNATYHGKSTGSIILSGSSLLKSQNQITPSILEEKYRGKIGNLVANGDYLAGWSAFKSAYAYFESEAGNSQKNKDGAMNTSSFEKALDATTGGLYEQQNTSLLFFGGRFKTANGFVSNWKVQKPYLMSNADFEIRANSGLEQIAKKHNLPVNFVKDNYRLQARDGTTYDDVVVYDLLDANGQRWVVKGKSAGEKDKYQMITIPNKRRH